MIFDARTQDAHGDGISDGTSIGYPNIIRPSCGLTGGYPVKRETTGGSAPAARWATGAVSARAAFHPHLGDVFGQSGPHGGVARTFEPQHQVVGELLAVGLAPTVREQVLQARGSGLAELVRTGYANVEALVEDLFVVGHGHQG
jgi:hypothetical protein